MSDELYEVAFSGQIAEGADIEQVKTKVAAIFKADAAKLDQLFSGKRVVIKKNIDQAMAGKYRAALNNAGAVCEVKSLLAEPQGSAVEGIVVPVAPPPAPAPAPAGDIPPAPQTAPLGVAAEDIADLSVSLAPPGSDMQDGQPPPVAPEIDVSGMDVAPVGSDLGPSKKEAEPPPPDTDGLSMAD
ncbi:hypothetical protein MNBD_GAMMA11-1420 [hydrothermal vent metagenome]|uniref:Uncharacterized protein n=1 Tax=hydrothermal vent metagenome TaxID=652676 RepID=A0A3B0X8Z6_9ZZZZ